MEPFEIANLQVEPVDLIIWFPAVGFFIWIFGPVVLQCIGMSKYRFEAIEKPDRVRLQALDHRTRKLAEPLQELGFEPVGRLNETTDYAHGRWTQEQTLDAWATRDRAIYALFHRIDKFDHPRITLVSYLLDYTELITAAPGVGQEWNKRRSIRVEMPHATVAELVAAHRQQVGEAMAQFGVEVAGPSLADVAALRKAAEEEAVRTGKTLRPVALTLMGQYITPAAVGVLGVVRYHRASLGYRTVAIAMVAGGVGYLFFWIVKSQALVRKQSRNDHLQLEARNILEGMKRPPK